MKKTTVTKVILILSLLFSMEATAQEVINYFYMKAPVCAPVTLSTDNGTMMVNNGDRIDGNIRIHSATDGNGNKILDITADKVDTGTGKPTVREYTFQTLYPSGNTYGGNDDTYSYDEPAYGSAPPSSGMGDVVTGGLNNLAEGMRAMTRNAIPVSGYPYLALDLGMSRMYGEFARLHICLGGDVGFMLYGGVGKDWIFNGDNKDKMSWHAGVGYYGVLGSYEEQQFNFGVSYSETAVIEGGALNFDLGYRYFFGKSQRFGLFGGAGFGVGNVNECFESRSENEKFPGKFVWDIQLGICVKIFASKR
ncbi:MAG: hypothetical protein NC344_09155 [Bacteroidales bacterium]|nr:hypothetical protein [Bacteroidales bacterium]MCM1147977.1 hypothetical protein [Bacteroidales bacterium]MCM1206901.1 hypothetical protein [Bacillota bacterium]MCM1509534.1 hypothetical protein [Clostridium sp.]